MRISDWSSDVCSSDLGHVKQSKPIPIPAFPLKGKGQKGVALLTVLLLVAVMSVLVMGMLDDIRFGLRRASNAQAMAQAQWYALGAESLAMAQIDRQATRPGAQAGPAGMEHGQPGVPKAGRAAG